MDNEREVTDLIERSKSLFLQETAEEFRRKSEEYDVGREFAKTKRNRTLLVPGVIVATLIVFSAAAVFLNIQIERSAQEVELDPEQFADISLRDVLDSWLRVERRIGELEQTREELTAERDARLRLARRAGDRQIALLHATDMNDDERAEQIAAIENQTEETVAGINAEYDDELSSVDEELADLERRQAEEFDQDEVETALERQDLLDDEGRRLLQMELEDQRERHQERLAGLEEAYEQEIASHDEYSAELQSVLLEQHETEVAELREEHEQEIEELTMRYNPDLSDEGIASLLDAELPQAQAEGAFRQVLARTETITSAGYQELLQQQEELDRLLARLQEIPYQNSIPRALDQLRSRAGLVTAEYERIWNRLGDRYQELEAGYAELEQEYDELEQERITIERELREELAETEEQFAQQLSEQEEQLDQEVDRQLQEVRERLEAEIEAYQERLETATSERDSFEHAFDRLIVEDRESGFIVDPRNSSRMLVILDPIREVDEDTYGVVFRDRDGLVAEISFFEDEGRMWARTEELADGAEVHPFDRILVHVDGAAADGDFHFPEGGEVIEERTQE